MNDTIRTHLKAVKTNPYFYAVLGLLLFSVVLEIQVINAYAYTTFCDNRAEMLSRHKVSNTQSSVPDQMSSLSGEIEELKTAVNSIKSSLNDGSIDSAKTLSREVEEKIDGPYGIESRVQSLERRIRHLEK